MNNIPFIKMHGLGNDFVVLDQRHEDYALTEQQVRAMADRGTGIGFDQLLVIEKPQAEGVDLHCRIFNADGHEVAQCGNGMRCLVRYAIEQEVVDGPSMVLSTSERVMHGQWDGGEAVTVDMGIPDFSAQGTPIAWADDSKAPYQLKHASGEVSFYTVNVGNPHAVVQVDSFEGDKVHRVGGWLSRHSVFPEGANVGFMHVMSPQHIELQVYERGAGQTRACGSGACAAVVIGRYSGLLESRVVVDQPGGRLTIDWQGPGQSIQMSGPAAMVYQGIYTTVST